MENKELSVPNPEPKKSNCGGIIFVVLFNLLLGIWLWLGLLCLVMCLIGCEYGIIMACAAMIMGVSFLGSFLTAGVFLTIAIVFAAIAGFAVCYFAIRLFVKLTAWYVSLNCRLWKEGL